MIIGTVSSITSGKCSVKIDGETTATSKKYKTLSSYTPAVGDRVLIAEIAGSYVILGKIKE